MDFKEYSLPRNPRATANPISKLLFLWIFPLFMKGYQKELQDEDLYKVLKEDETGQVGDQLEKYWNLELERAKRKGKKPSLLRVVVKYSWKTFAFATILYTINKLTVPAAQAIFLKLLIQTFNEGNTETWKGYFYAAGISLSVLLNTITIQPNYFEIMHLGMKLRVGVSTLIYRKTLRLSKSAQLKTNSGQIVNLLSNDCARFDLSMNFFPGFVSAPFQVTLLMYLLYTEIGAASFAGVGFMVLVLPWQYYLGKYTGIFRRKVAKRTDERGRFMNEIIVGMRVIKQYAWEKPFSILIDGIRKLEVNELRKRGLLRGLHLSVLIFAPKLVQYLTFLALILIGAEPMSADKVFFTLICLYYVMQTLVHVSPLAVAGLGEILVTIGRVQEFLQLEEQRTNSDNMCLNNAPAIIKNDEADESTKLSNGRNSDNISLDVVINNSRNTMAKKVSMKNVCASWTDERATLDNVNFSVEGDKLIMIVGPVGSSKTSLLHAILDELPISSGNLTISGRISYASQEPWIFSGNLRQNILFGLPYDEAHYKATLASCALEEDLKQLPYGDMTVVGERGVALSGGQKARVNLARALYRKADIYLLDDPLSAVDSKVSRHLFEKCVKEHLKGSIRLLVTHQLQYLPQADHILVLNQGQILAQGKYEELVASGINFVGLMKYSNESNDHDGASDQNVVHNHACESEKLDKGKPEENFEKKMAGSVTFGTYKEYFLAGHSAISFLALMASFLVCQVLSNGNDYWLSFWTNVEAKRVDLKNNSTSCAQLNDESCEDSYLGEINYLYVYTGFVVGVTVFNLIRCLWFYTYSAKISVSIHDKMFRSMVRAPIKFYDDNPSGRIMNRFTKDVGTMDELLPPAFIDTIIIFLQGIGSLGVVIISNYYMSIPTVILFVVLYVSRRVFVMTARDIKRIESITKSPIFTHVTATIQGLTTIRASKSQNLLIEQFEGQQDIHSAAYFLFLSVNRCFAIWLELISDVFLAIVAFSFLLISTSQEGGNVGLAISSLLTIMDIFQWGMRQSAETENFMTSVERALEYSKLTPEAELNSKPSSKPAQDWPVDGQIEFRKVSLSYNEDTPVLKNLSFEIRPSEKIGIVGRTGAGKSSIITALFRLTEPKGEILIDNVDIKQIGLHDLRKSISIIPQDPVLFSGSIRYNLDPFNQFRDHDLWRVIEEVELKDAVSSLEYKVADGGSNFSVGQRQLVCLARAILRKNKILVMDEATANVDPRTDHLIQQTIRSKFSDCTIITIAHRLHSIIDCDRILVLDQGQLVEYDHPHVLLQNDAGIFSTMINQTGQSSSEMLRKLANDNDKRQE